MRPLLIDTRLWQAGGIGTYLQALLPQLHLPGPVQLLGRDQPFHAPIYSVQEQWQWLQTIQKQRPAGIWVPHFNIPLFYSGPLVATVHDVFHLAMPEFVGRKRFYADVMFAALARRAQAVFTVSHFSKTELLRYTRIPAERITVTPLGVAPWQPTGQPRPQTKPYILYIGNVKPHKNLGLLVSAFQRMANRIPHDLIIVGQTDGFRTADTTLTARLKRLEGRIHLTGRVSDLKRRQYLEHADAFIFPSRYEGFGLPPLEAMAAGVPVIVSTAGSLPEVCGDAALYTDPNDPEELAERLWHILSDSPLRATLIQRGLTRCRRFSWDTCAETTRHVLAKTLEWPLTAQTNPVAPLPGPGR
jgi:glycosyltransferase involved in cell wall biosynthesis